MSGGWGGEYRWQGSTWKWYEAIGFGGQRVDLESGVYAYAYRDYDALTGQWLEEDPIRAGEGWYAFCAQNSLSFVDPLGLQEHGVGICVESDWERVFTPLDKPVPWYDPASRQAARGAYSLLACYPGQINREGYYVLPQDAYEKLYTSSFYSKYQAEVREKTTDPEHQLSGLATGCNVFIKDYLAALGPKVYADIMPAGTPSPYELYQSWENNPKLEKLGNTIDSWRKAAEYADLGYVVLAVSDRSYDQHVAVGAPSTMNYQTIPTTDWKERPGKAPPQGSVNMRGELGKDWPPFLQGGSYTGIVAPGWAFSPKLIEGEYVHFYVYKPGANK